MIIRQEQEKDYPEVYEMVKQSFAATVHADGTEQDYLNQLRLKESFIPELSLVAEEKGRIVGQITLYEMNIMNETQLVLSPLSVHPGYFGRGIGSRLIGEGCKKAVALGYKAVFLCGEYAYYARFGFMPTWCYGIHHQKDVAKNADWCMVKELEKGYLEHLSGTIDIE